MVGNAPVQLHATCDSLTLPYTFDARVLYSEREKNEGHLCISRGEGGASNNLRGVASQYTATYAQCCNDIRRGGGLLMDRPGVVARVQHKSI